MKIEYTGILGYTREVPESVVEFFTKPNEWIGTYDNQMKLVCFIETHPCGAYWDEDDDMEGVVPAELLYPLILHLLDILRGHSRFDKEYREDPGNLEELIEVCTKLILLLESEYKHKEYELDDEDE